MVSAHQRADGRVARQFLGYFIEDEYKEIVQIEYRYTPGGGFDLCTHIRGRDYRITEHKFFSAMAELLDRLPLTSTLVISHQIVMAYPDSAEEKATLEEWLFPFGGEKPTGTVVYQLKLLAGGRRIETSRYTSSGYPVTDFGAAAEELRRNMGSDIRPKICYFCKYLIEYNDFGGTDYRHDQLYCFRDSPETLVELMKMHPDLRNLRTSESLLTQGTPDMDAVHSCSAFIYRDTPRV